MYVGLFTYGVGAFEGRPVVGQLAPTSVWNDQCIILPLFQNIVGVPINNLVIVWWPQKLFGHETRVLATLSDESALGGLRANLLLQLAIYPMHTIR